MQKVLEDDPTLGLGDLGEGRRNRDQLPDPESSTRYEVELQLGPTDESHIRSEAVRTRGRHWAEEWFFNNKPVQPIVAQPPLISGAGHVALVTDPATREYWEKRSTPQIRRSIGTTSSKSKAASGAQIHTRSADGVARRHAPGSRHAPHRDRVTIPNAKAGPIGGSREGN